MKLKRISYGVLLVLSLAVSSAYSQQYKPEPLPVRKSNLITELKALRAAKPNINPAQLAEAANVILDNSGINFAASFDSATCERIKKIKAERKDPNAPLALGATLKSVDAEGASLALPEPVFSSGDCGCYVELPLLQATDKDFIALISGRNIKFHKPTNLHFSEGILVDSKDQTAVKRKWSIPFRGTPIGVSHDENVIYLAFFEPELADLSFAVFGEGVFQIATRAEAEEGGKGEKIQPPQPSPTQQIKFLRWGKTFLVTYSPPCES